MEIKRAAEATLNLEQTSSDTGQAHTIKIEGGKLIEAVANAKVGDAYDQHRIS